MGDTFRKVVPGSPMEIPAAAYNAMVEAAKAHRDRASSEDASGLGRFMQNGIVSVQNDSGEDLGRFAVLGVDVPIIGPTTEGIHEFQSRFAVTGIIPDGTTHRSRFVVLAEPMKDGQIGRGFIAGVCPVKVRILDPKHQYADVADEETVCLESGNRGGAQILWKQSGKGVKWAIVRILAEGRQVLALEHCEGIEETLVMDDQLVGFLGRVVKMDGKCWHVRPATEEEMAEGIEAVPPDRVEDDYDDCDECNQCYLLTECSPGTGVKTTMTKLSAYVGKVVKLSDNKCYLVSTTTNCADAERVAVSASQVYATCDECMTKCYHLVNCWDAGDTKTVDNNLAAEVMNWFEAEMTPAEVVASSIAFRINGKCYDVTGYDTSCGGSSMADVQDVYQSCAECGCLKLTECAGGADEVLYVKALSLGGATLSNTSVVGKVVRLTSNNKCYTVSSVNNSGCNGAADTAAIHDTYADCSGCQRYKLTECPGGGSDVRYSYKNLARHVGKVVKLSAPETAAGKCYTVSVAAGADGAGSEQSVTVASSYDTCDLCKATYLLTNDCEQCETTEAYPPIVTAEDFSKCLGQWVKVNGICYKVTVNSEHLPATSTGPFKYTGPYASCDLCKKANADAEIKVIYDITYDPATKKLTYKSQRIVVEKGLIKGLCNDTPTTVFTAQECPEP